MRQCHPSPLRRLLRVTSLMIGLLVLATACTLNPAPDVDSIAAGPPVVRLAAPLPNATYLEGVAVNVQAYVSNAGADIDRVEIAVDNAVIQTFPAPNANGAPVFSVTHSWTAAGVGSHVVAATAFRGDGSASSPATATINVISPVRVPEETEVPTLPPSPEPPDEGNGDEGGEDTTEGNGDEGGNEDGGDEGNGDEGGEESGSPTVTFTQGVNVRRGPGTNFVPPLGAFATGQTADLLGVNPAGDWYKVRYYNAEGWVFASLVEVSGNVDELPVDPGPPTPIPATATPIPPTPVPVTAVPQSQANLVAGEIRLDPSQPICGETFQVEVDIANLGSTDTTTSGLFTVQDVHVASGTVAANTQGPIPIVRAGETISSAEIPITVDTYVDEKHKIVVILNPSGAIPETGSGDNRREIEYTLGSGC